MAMLTLDEGRFLVGLARRSIGEYLASGRKLRPEEREGALSEERGVFVTLEAHPSRELRGCIGYPLPIKRLSHAVCDNALHAAFEDPRFPPLEKGELGKTAIEVSVLSVPEEIVAKTPEEVLRKVKVGRDGLIIEYGYSSGLLLPQVPVEWNWDAEEFLGHLCEKAGLPKNMWKSPSARIKRFEAQIFYEEAPGGKVLQKRLFK